MVNLSNFNGVKGEYRTQAILSDNFFILVRSIDTDGVDFIVQSIHEENIFSTKLARIQSKFREKFNSPIDIHESYIKDDKGNIREGFVLLVHTGEISKMKIYAMSSKDIDNNCICKNKKYKVTKKVLDNHKKTVKKISSFVENNMISIVDIKKMFEQIDELILSLDFSIDKISTFPHNEEDFILYVSSFMDQLKGIYDASTWEDADIYLAELYDMFELKNAKKMQAAIMQLRHGFNRLEE